MSDKFNISDDFEMYEAESAGAVNEAAKAEKNVMGIKIPVGTTGKAAIVGIEGGKSKDKVDPNTKQVKPGGPMITVTLMAVTPDAFAGQKVMQYFPLSPTATQTKAKKWQRFYDAMDDMGMPKELRGAKLAEIAKWAGQEQRTFMYEIKQHWSNPADKEMIAMGAGGNMPNLADLEAAGNEAAVVDWKVGDKGTCGGNGVTITEVLENGMLKAKFDSNGAEMPIPASSVVKS